MKLALIFAMELEQAAFLKEIEKTQPTFDFTTHICGIGKVAAASKTMEIILTKKPDLIINCGVAGGINNAKQFDVYISNLLAYADVDLRVFGYTLGQMACMPKVFKSFNLATLPKMSTINIKYGNILSQDTFALNPQQTFFESKFSDYDIVDMESTAIAQTCFMNGVQFIAVRAISDCIFEPNQHLQYEKAADKAAALAAQVSLDLINNL
ncbi:MAG: 5'-methylthioadenosine/S-adenosylhomocysteine nucleosidase [Mycoplasmatales bacterium]